MFVCDDPDECADPLSVDDTNPTSAVTSTWVDDIVYLSLFAVMGFTIRVYLGRFFGGDCTSYESGNSTIIDDFLWPVSHKVCITTDGKTVQYGGALFIDLPANIIGCLIMGYFTSYPNYKYWPAFPCLSHEHPWQHASSLHLGIRTGLCGSITTFSSWNTQMVVMMDGTGLVLGSQVLAALFGYIIGYQSSLYSFRAGRTFGAFTHARRNPHAFDSALRSKKEFHPRCHHKHLNWMTPAILFIIVGAVISLFVAGDLYWKIPYYRELWIGALLSPFGAIVRWKLAVLNGKLGLRDEHWFPTGTFLANFIGCIISAIVTAWAIVETKNDTAQQWGVPILKAIALGVAGCLSTVSTFAKECVELREKNPPFDKKQCLYSFGTTLSCCLIGLVCYSPFVRFA
jgi:fluoride ion exporter CrcB/FEX